MVLYKDPGYYYCENYSCCIINNKNYKDKT